MIKVECKPLPQAAPSHEADRISKLSILREAAWCGGEGPRVRSQMASEGNPGSDAS